MISAVVLAAGASRRLGRPKQLLELDGKPLLQHVVDACVGAGLDEVVVVLGHEAERVRAALARDRVVRTVTNASYRSGQASSLAAGLDAVDARAEAVVIVLGDQPRLSAEAIRRAVAEWQGSRAPVVRSYYGNVPGHPVVAARSAWDVLRAARGDRGARDTLADSAIDVVRVDMGSPPLDDVDTWEQYERLRAGD
jgi:molybdenum cofactor cytidylyltransferase